MKRFPKCILGVVGLLAVGLGQRAAAAPSVCYGITPLLGLNLPYSPAFINSQGMVACGDVVWQHGKRWTIHNPLHDPRYSKTEAAGINDAGMVVGTFKGVEDGAWLVGYGKVFVWQSGHVVVLPPADASDLANPLPDGINRNGDILVRVTLQAPNPDDVVYKTYLYHAGKYQLCDTAKADVWVNSQGQFVAIDSPLSVAPLSGENQTVTGANGAGWIIGQYQKTRNSVSVPRACVWRKRRCEDIGPRSGGASNAAAINNRGQVVGSYGTGKMDKQEEITHAFVWQHGRMTDLNRLLAHKSGWVLYEADAINDQGQIVCWGNKGACLLTPMPIAAKLH